MFADKLDEMTRRCWGLQLAIHGAIDDQGLGELASGLHQIATDLAEDMKRLSEAHSAERYDDRVIGSASAMVSREVIDKLMDEGEAGQ
jgi:hypothetical protein